MNTQTLLAAIGNPRGHFSKKENRAAKLLAIWPELEAKLENMVVRGAGESETARLAYATLLMMDTGIRVGNEGSAEGYVCDLKYSPLYGQTVQTYGLTTLQHRHVERYKKKWLVIDFIGKKATKQSLVVTRPLLWVFSPTPGEPSDSWLNIDYNSLKKFVKRYVGHGYSPKDLRTAKVNQLFVSLFPWSEYILADTKRDRKALLADAIAETAADIGHTKGVCKASYLSKPLLNYIGEWR